ncbi:MAG: DegT/DnrJ/EryC1/StrS family aminotransferase [Nitrospira sp.]|nr:DegT/DnrJ/EryC1/StrS family aminotransferase [Nitrospira sp.]MCP9476166.1 DegT/DnrJ/EryC1/StrS family aminotransferase [Nitrospira sp.]
MAARFRFVPPAGTPVGFSDVAGSIGTALIREDSVERFKAELCARVKVRHCEFVSTGRAALTLALLALKELDGGRRQDVIIPSYTCFSVPSSVVKAGLRVRLADVNPETLDFLPDSLARIDGTRVLAVVATNLYGLPNDVERWRCLTQERGVYLIDDAAQCLGGSVAGRQSGTWGDVGLYSFDKGKNVTSIDGGVLVTNSDRIAAAISAQVKRLRDSTIGESLTHMVKLLVYATFLHPRRYWIPNSLPFLGLGTTAYRTDYPLAQYDKWMAPLGRRLFARLDAIAAQRRAAAERYAKRLPWGSLLRPIVPRPTAEPAYLRYPVLVAPECRDRVMESLRQKGIGATASYPSAINDIPEIQDLLKCEDREISGGRDLAKQILTLPTHGYVTEEDQDRIAAIIGETLGS